MMWLWENSPFCEFLANKRREVINYMSRTLFSFFSCHFYFFRICKAPFFFLSFATHLVKIQCLVSLCLASVCLFTRQSGLNLKFQQISKYVRCPFFLITNRCCLTRGMLMDVQHLQPVSKRGFQIRRLKKHPMRVNQLETL